MEEGLLEENLKLGEKRDLAGQGESEQRTETRQSGVKSDES